MTGSAVETRYGRRGGGWATQAPGEAQRAFADNRENPEPPKGENRACGLCGLKVKDHSGDLCPVCRRPVEHHQGDDLTLEWAGRSRMAAARRTAGIELDLVDLQSLRKAGL